MGKRLWVERDDQGTWHAYREDGAHLVFGKGPGEFNPGDLMKIALAGCAALSSQTAIEQVLGDNRGARIIVDGTYDPDANGYLNFGEQMVVDASDATLSDEQVDELRERITRHVDKACTVKHTYETVTPVRMNITISR